MSLTNTNMKTLRADWKVEKPVFHPETTDGDNTTGGPTDSYYRVWAQHVPTGNFTLGQGPSPTVALSELEKHIEEWEPPVTFGSLQKEIEKLKDRLTKAGL